MTELPRDEKWGNLEVAKVKHWVCIPAAVQYTIWSDIYRCEGFVTIEEPTGKVSTRGKNVGNQQVRRKRVARGCGREIVLWETAVDAVTGEVGETFKCTNPACGHVWKKINLKRCGFVPVISKYGYVGLQHTKRGIEALNKRLERKVSTREKVRLKEISAVATDRWCPSQPMDIR